MRESLGRIAEALAAGANLLRVQVDVVAIPEELDEHVDAGVSN